MSGGGWPRRDLFCALAVGLAALALYVATLQPDMGGPEDTTKFQLVGYVLGTAHPPGYPFYVLLSHLFVKLLPIRTVAYRANLFSAVLAGLACSLAFLLARQVGSTRWAAVCAALGLATGASFWRSAVYAEVYSLAASMAALTIALLLAWGERGGARLLLAAVAAFALGAGNHLTIVGLVPAFALYVLLRNFRALTPRVIAAATVILLLGVSQYGFIVLRTYQRAPYLESRATSLSELWSVMTAQRFAEERFAFSPSDVITRRVPAVASVIGDELGAAGALLLGLGILAAAYSRSAGAALVAGAAGGTFALVANLSGDFQGFITPLMVLVWPFTALGIDAIARVLEGLPAVGPALGALAVTAAAALPVAHLAANYKDADKSQQTRDGQFLRAMYSQLPDKAGIVAENYWYNMTLFYLMLTGETGPARGIGTLDLSPRPVRDLERAGRRVFAFSVSATFLSADGLQFERIGVVGPPLGEWLAGLPRDTVVVGAAAHAAVPSEINRRIPRPAGRPPSFAAFALIAGQSGADRREGDEAASLAVERGALGSSLPPFPGAVLASSDGNGARVRLAGRTIAEVDAGLALAVFAPDGSLSRTLEFPSGEPERVPFQGALYELKSETPCVDVTTDAWTDAAPALSTGSWVATMPAMGSVVIESVVSDPRGVRARASELLGGGAARIVGRSRNADGSDVLLTELRRTTGYRPVFRLALDYPPALARARVRSGGVQSSLRLCANQPHQLFPGSGDRASVRADFESEAFFGAGWGGAERLPTGYVRRGQDGATLLLPLEPGYGYRVSLDVAAPAGTSVGITANGAAVGTCALREGAPCEADVPSSVVRKGVSALALSVPRSAPPEQHRVELIFQGARILRQRPQ